MRCDGRPPLSFGRGDPVNCPPACHPRLLGQVVSPGWGRQRGEGSIEDRDDRKVHRIHAWSSFTTLYDAANYYLYTSFRSSRSGS